MKHAHLKDRISTLMNCGEDVQCWRIADWLCLGKSHVVQVLRDMTQDGTLEEVAPQVFRKRSMARQMIVQPWVRGRLDPGHFRGGEWA